MTFRLYTLGCKMNAYESEAIREKLLKAGLEEKKEGEADLFFVNTCAVTKVAENKDKKLVRELSRTYPHSRIFVMGCSSQIHPEWYRSIDHVEGVTGTERREDLLTCLLGGSISLTKDTRSFAFDSGLSISSSAHEAKAYIKVQDGCNNFCSYCIVPYTRGVSRSRSHVSVLEEAKRLLANGEKELILGGIDVGSYKDPNEEDYRLKHLLRDLATLEPEKDYRVRVSSIEASQIDDEYISLFHDYPDKICPHFHIPLQSGCQKILTLMNRRYSLKAYEEMCDKIKKEVPDVGLSTDIILGFPGETEEDFEETLAFLKRIGFLRIHAFPYSEREGTPAASLRTGVVPMEVRRERTRKVITLGKELEKQYRLEHKGEKVKVLIENVTEDGIATGYSGNYLPFSFYSPNAKVDTFVEREID